MRVRRAGPVAPSAFFVLSALCVGLLACANYHQVTDGGAGDDGGETGGRGGSSASGGVGGLARDAGEDRLADAVADRGSFDSGGGTGGGQMGTGGTMGTGGAATGGAATGGMATGGAATGGGGGGSVDGGKDAPIDLISTDAPRDVPGGGTGGAATGGAGTGGTATGGAATGGSGTGGMPPPINVLVWNTATAFGHQSRATAIPFLQARETTDNIKFDVRFAHTTNVTEGPSDTTSDQSVFTDAGLAPYDVVLFLNTSGNTLDLGGQASVHRQALIDFMKKGRGFVGTHSAADTYQGSAWPWYVDFLGANFKDHSNAGTMGTARAYQGTRHAILTAANTPDPWNRSEEWYTFTRDLIASPAAGITIILTCTDLQLTQERPSAWVHEMPPETGVPRVGRLFYTAFGHTAAAFQEVAVMDLIIAGIKWAAYRL